MNRNFDRALPLVLAHEGGYVNHPRDPGGATNLGVTIHTARRLGIDVDGDGDTDVADIRALKPHHAAKVYRANYWNAVRGDDLPAGVDYATFDFAVNSGPNRAIKYLQRAVGVDDDGTIGPITLDAVFDHDPVELVNDLCDARLAFLKRIKTWPTFGRGWGRRVAGVREHATAMARSASLVEPVPPPPDVPLPDSPERPPTSPPVGRWGLLTLLVIAAVLGAAFFLSKLNGG